MAQNIGSVTAAVYSNIDELPTTLSGTNLDTFANRALIRVGNWINSSLSYPIDDKYFNVVTNVATSMVLARKAGVGVDGDVSLGDLSIRAAENKDAKLAVLWLEEAKQEMLTLGRHVGYARTY